MPRLQASGSNPYVALVTPATLAQSESRVVLAALVDAASDLAATSQAEGDKKGAITMTKYRTLVEVVQSIEADLEHVKLALAVVSGEMWEL